MAEEDIRKLLAEDLGPISKVMFLRNHGVVVCGETIEEASYYLMNVMAACEIQSRAMIGGLDNLIIPNTETQKRFLELAHAQNETVTVLENKKWKVGELEFEALMRSLDNAGYRTGYFYRQPVMRSIDRNAVKEVEIPPAATSHGFDAEYIKRLKEEKQKALKGEWLASPNAYTRAAEQASENSGTPSNKKITKWVPESSPNKTSTPIRIENKNQFAPQGVDPKELKNHQKQVWTHVLTHTDHVLRTFLKLEMTSFSVTNLLVRLILSQVVFSMFFEKKTLYSRTPFNPDPVYPSFRIPSFYPDKTCVMFGLNLCNPEKIWVYKVPICDERLKEKSEYFAQMLCDENGIPLINGKFRYSNHWLGRGEYYN